MTKQTMNSTINKKTQSQISKLYIPCLLSLLCLSLFACEPTECQIGMTRCAPDNSAIQSCDRGKWVNQEVCTEGFMCMPATADSTAAADEDATALRKCAAALPTTMCSTR